MTSVLLVDDHAIVRAGIRHALEQHGIAVCGETDDGGAVLDLVRTTTPDVVLLDVALGIFDGIVLAKRIAALAAGPRIVMLSMFADTRVIDAAADAGAHAYLVKDCPLDELIATVVDVACGADALATRRAARTASSPARPLSGRELEVLQLVAAGATTLEVAARLFVSAKTVKNHLSAVFDKLGVSSRTQAVAVASRRGLITLATRSEWDVRPIADPDRLDRWVQ